MSWYAYVSLIVLVYVCLLNNLRNRNKEHSRLNVAHRRTLIAEGGGGALRTANFMEQVEDVDTLALSVRRSL
jgi:hypothetical protein